MYSKVSKSKLNKSLKKVKKEFEKDLKSIQFQHPSSINRQTNALPTVETANRSFDQCSASVHKTCDEIISFKNSSTRQSHRFVSLYLSV